jgi:uncharacterized protein YndB with AHSA1/START domain
MPVLDAAAHAAAPVEEVWKLLYDPERFPDWWQGLAAVAPAREEGAGDVTFFPDGHPDFPLPQLLRADGDGRGVTVSCLVSRLVFAWRLAPAGHDDEEATRISVHVEIPEAEAHRLETQRESIRASLRALAELAEATAAPPARG